VVLPTPSGILHLGMLDNAVIFKISIDNLLLSHHGENIRPGKKGGNLLSNNLSTTQLVEKISDNGSFQSSGILIIAVNGCSVLKKIPYRKLILHIYNIMARDGVKRRFPQVKATIVKVFIPYNSSS